MLDGAARLDDLFEQCNRPGMSAIAMTDHGNVYGAYDFYKKAKAAGVKPIIGTEAYVAPEHRGHKQPVRWGTPAQRDDDVSGAGAYTHMTLLAETTRGHAQPVQAVVAGLDRGLLPPAEDGPRTALQVHRRA